MQDALFFQWGVSTLFGWGVYGLNLLRHWRHVAGSPAYSLAPVDLASLAGMDKLGLLSIAQSMVDSDQMQRRLGSAESGQTLDGVVLHSLGNRFAGSRHPAAGGQTGRATAAVIFFEDTHLPNAAQIAADYDLVITGSSWCEQVLRSRGVTNVVTVVQGVDPSLFHPAPRSGALEGRFAVFSGGKLERRKGQDLVLLAFRAFAERHPEAVLVTSWHSPWPVVAMTVNANPAVAPVARRADGQVDVEGWAFANGLPEGRVIDLGSVPNHLMGRILREMDVAVFPNRCEGGTNLVAMECMACGVPTIVSNNTGHLDLVATGAAAVLSRQLPVVSDGVGTEGWGESDVDEIVAALEQVYNDRQAAARCGQDGAAALAKWSWRQQVGLLHQALAPLTAGSA